VRLLLPLAAYLAAALSPVTVHVVYDPTFTPAELAVLRAEARAWTDAVPSLRVVDRIAECCDDTPGTCVARVPRSAIDDAVGSSNTVAVTAQRPGGPIVYIDPEDPATRSGTFAHELGHAMGLMHDKHRHTLMYATQYCSLLRDPCDWPVPTFRDVSQWYILRLEGK